MGVKVRRSGEDGFTTVGIAISVLLVFALLFASCRVLWISSTSGSVQYVADAGALAADDVVADYVTAGQTVDAVLFTLSMAALTLYGVSTVAAFIPGGAEVATQIEGVATKIVNARRSFAKSAQKGLSAVQKVLPALCGLAASRCVAANAKASGVSYKGIAICSPLQGVKVEISQTSAVDDADQKFQDMNEDSQEAANKQEDAAEALQAAKEAAWEADCGKSGMSMRERAAKLAGLSDVENPDYSSVDSWSFQVPLQRARAYYQARYEAEAGGDATGSPEKVGQSVARKRFYAYAKKQLAKSRVGTDKNGKEVPRFKSLPRNKKQVMDTPMYTEAVYPVSEKDGVRTLHAWTGCPGYTQGTPCGTMAVSSIDQGKACRCSYCKFSAATLGRVPSASTSINNGFEYYYRALLEAASDYNAAREEAADASEEIDQIIDQVTSTIKEIFKKLGSERYDPQPPGRYGCICVVVAPKTNPTLSTQLFESSGIGTRVAISGSTLAADPDVSEYSALESVGKNLFSSSSLADGFPKLMLGGWSSLLKIYVNGSEGVEKLFASAVSWIPLVGTDLSEAVTGKLEDAMESVGMEPPDLKAYVPVLVNTSRILEADESPWAQALLAAKKTSQGDMSAVENALSALAACGTAKLSDILTDEGLEIASLDLGESGLGTGSLPLLFSASKNFLSEFSGTLSSITSALGGT